MKTKNKTLFDLYAEEQKKPTAASIFKKELAEVTQKSPWTVRMWLLGRTVPDKLTQKVIAEKYNLDIETLFKKD